MPVSSGWKPELISMRAASLPRIVISPAVGVVIPARILRIVVFPAPLCPTMPSASPSFTSKLRLRRAHISSRFLANPRLYQRFGELPLAPSLYFLDTRSNLTSIMSDHVRHSCFRRFEERVCESENRDGRRSAESEHTHIRRRAVNDQLPKAFDQPGHRIKQIPASEPNWNRLQRVD